MVLGIFIGIALTTLLFGLEVRRLRLALKEKGDRPLRVEGPALGLLGLYAQINEMILSHQRKASALLDAEKNLKEQISHISHDLRTPLTSILGYIELWEEAKNKEEAKACVAVVKKRSQSLRELLNDFHDLACLNDEAALDPPKMLDLASVLEQSLFLFHQDFEQAGIHLSLDLSHGQKRLDSEHLLSRCYMNLIRNILQYAHKEASIVHGVQNGRLCTRFSNAIRPGKAPELDRLFERFYRDDPSRNQSATGLGLYLSSELLAKLGHQISADISDGWITVTISYRDERHGNAF